MSDRCTENAQTILLSRELTEFLHTRGRNTSARDVLRNPVPDIGRAVIDLVEIETTQYRSFVVDEHVKHASSGLLFGQLGVVLIGEIQKIFVTAVGNRSGKVRSICQFKG